MKYKYQAKTREGELQVGFIEAGTKDSAASILAGHGLFILTLEAAETVHWYDRLSSYFSAVRKKDFVIFSRQLALLLNARLPLGDALRNLAQQTQNQTLKESIILVSEDINSGLSFSQALERQSGVFSDFFVSLVRASEVTGNLAEAASFLADYYEKELIITSKVKSALMYPVIVIFLFVGVSILLITVVFPQIGPVFAQAQVELPLFTRILLGSGEFLSRWWLAMLVSLLVIIATILDYARTTEGEAVFDELKIRLPIVGKVHLPLMLTRISNNASILLHGGVPMAQTLEIVSQTVDNAIYEELLRDISNDVRQGETLSKAMSKHPDYFPTLVPQMLAVGEITGQVDEIFTRVATLYGRELDDTINNMTELIQPVMMVGLGLLTGLLFGSILIPLYKLVSTFQ